MVSGEPPLIQHRQDQGAGGGLQETEQRTHPSPSTRHLWSGWAAVSSSAFTSLRISHGVILHLHCGEHPDRLHHHLVWKQHRCKLQSSAKGRANCPPHCWRWASLPPGHLHQAVCKESPEDHQGLQPHIPQTALSAGLRKTSPQHPIPH